MEHAALLPEGYAQPGQHVQGRPVALGGGKIQARHAHRMPQGTGAQEHRALAPVPGQGAPVAR